MAWESPEPARWAEEPFPVRLYSEAWMYPLCTEYRVTQDPRREFRLRVQSPRTSMIVPGDTPYKADTSMASLYKRTREKVPPPIELVPEIPKPLNAIVVRCWKLTRTSATRVLQKFLLIWSYGWAASRDPHRGCQQEAMGRGRQVGRSRSHGYLGRRSLRCSGRVVPQARTHKEVSLLVADFTNRTAIRFSTRPGPAFIIGLEGAFLHPSFNRSAARQEAAT